jgi:hypothetical protein
MSDRPINIHGDPLTPIVLDTNQGGIRTYLCGCGAFIHHELWNRHLDFCAAAADTNGELT